MTVLPSGRSTDPRVRTTLVEQAVEGYRETATSSRGHVLFLAGEPLSGRQETLQAIGVAVAREKPRPLIVRGRFSHGAFVPHETRRRGFPVKATASLLSRVMPMATTVAGHAINPVATLVWTLIAQVLGSSTVVKDLMERLASQEEQLPATPDSLRVVLRAAADTQPVVCLLTDMDEAGGSWWADFVAAFAREIVAELPVLLCVTLEGPPELGERTEHEPYAQTVARRLTDASLAMWLGLRPLTEEAIALWLRPVEPEIVRRLVTVTAGSAGWSMLLWQDWQQQGLVTRTDEDASWRFAREEVSGRLGLVDQVVRHRVRELVGAANVEAIERALELLRHGALEGRAFTAQALGPDADDVMEFLDDFLIVDEKRPNGLIRELGFVDIQDPKRGKRSLFRYEFVAELHQLTLARYGWPREDGRAAASLQLAKLLVELYAPDETQIARALALLFQVGEDVQAAWRYQTLAELGASRDALRWQVQLVLSADKTGWGRLDYLWAIRLLLEAGTRLRGVIPLSELLHQSDAAYGFAQRFGSRADLGRTQFQRGEVLHLVGDYMAAELALNHARELLHEVGDRTAEAGCWHELGMLYHNLYKHAEARKKLEHALRLFQEVCNWNGQAVCLQALGVLDRDHGNFTEARQKFERAFHHFQEIGDLDGQAMCMQGLGVMERTRGSYVEARQRFQNALGLFRELANERREAWCLRELGIVDGSEGRYTEAQGNFERSLGLHEKLGDRDGEARCWYDFSGMYQKRGNFAEAQEKLKRALKLFQDLHNQNDEARCWHGLSVLKQLQGKRVEELQDFERALKLFQDVGNQEGEARCWLEIGEAGVKQGTPTVARPNLERSLYLIQKVGDRYLEAKCSFDLSMVDYQQGNYAEAQRQLERALEIFKEVHHPEGEARCWRGLSALDQQQGKHAEAGQRLQQALKLFQEVGNQKEEEACWYSLGMLATRMGKTDKGARLGVIALHLATMTQIHDAGGIRDAFAALADKAGWPSDTWQHIQNESVLSYQQDGGETLLRAAFTSR